VLKGPVAHHRGRRDAELDVKHGAITLITNLARAWSIRCGVTENRTLRRLSAVTQLDRMDQETGAGLEEAFRLLWLVRMESQVAHVRSREAVDDLVNPRLLGPLTRQGVREAFRVIERAQGELALAFGVRR
jgi:signal-transduction protein with cAMP-binding, CBS, and nucleotidyltransferase domain